MSKYFSFYEEIIVITKKENTSIYNLINGNIYYFTHWKSEVIKALKNSEEIDQLCKTHSLIQEISYEEIMGFIAQLEQAHIGKITTAPFVKFDLVKPDYWLKLLFFKSSPSVSKAFIYFGANCKKGCLHCDGETIISENRCYSCSKSTVNPTLGQVEKFINITEILGCKEVVLVGGDLIIDADALFSVIETIPTSMSITIISGYYDCYNDKVFELLNRCDHVRIEANAEDLAKESFRMFSSKIKGINAELNINVLLDSDNEVFIPFPASVKNCYNLVKEVRLIRKEDFAQILKDEEIGVPSTSCKEYMYKNIFNSCMNGVLTMKGEGNLFVCPKIHETYLGNLNGLKAALCADNINKFWELTKKKIEICEDCSLNVACLDCRYLASFLYRDLYRMYPCMKNSSRH